MTTKKQNRNLLYSALLLLLLVSIGLGYLVKNYVSRVNNQAMIIEALQGGLKKTVDAAGRETAQKNILITSYKDLKRLHVADSSEIGRLKKMVGKHTTSAAVINNTTSGTLTGSTSVVFVAGDTLKNPCDTMHAVYTSTLTDEWGCIKVTASKDSTKADYTIRNEYEVKQELGDKQGKWPFRYRSLVLKVTNNNPHTTTDKISVWAVQTPNIKKKVATGVGIGFLGGILTAIIVTR